MSGIASVAILQTCMWFRRTKNCVGYGLSTIRRISAASACCESRVMSTGPCYIPLTHEGVVAGIGMVSYVYVVRDAKSSGGSVVVLATQLHVPTSASGVLLYVLVGKHHRNTGGIARHV
jgi:hypothetical protein